MDARASRSFPENRLSFSLSEFSGGLGDLGAFIPLTVGMSLVSGMDFALILLWSGLFSIVAGLIFRLPIPIQPMKSIAVVAIAEQLAPGEIVAAGVAVGAFVFLLGATNLISALERFIPRAIVRGIQLGVGLKLGVSGLRYIAGAPATGWDGIVVALLLGTVAVVMSRSRRFPTALLLFASGVAIALLESPPGADFLQTGLPTFAIHLPSSVDWKVGLLDGALPQIPLTLLNSVIAVCALSEDLFKGRGVSLKQMSLSIGIMNLIAPILGGMPMCHGSGGLAGHYRFGARTGGSVIMLGVFKIVAALVFGAGLIKLLQVFPESILGVLLVLAGVELALPARDMTGKREFRITVITALAIVALNTGVGFLVGAIYAALTRAGFRGGNQSEAG